ncbi:MAG: hypothetical protein GX605_01900, partial [Chloroflexi bacterium]|nr:hypothetical protein [Chloroflexota bacterium]
MLCVALMLCALASPTAMAQTQTTVRPIDNTIEVGVGQTAAINFLVENVEGLYGFEMHLRFDPAFIEVVDSYPDQPGVQVRPGNFLSVDLVVQNTVDNEFGLVDYAMTQLNPTEAKTGTGFILSLIVRGKAATEATVMEMVEVKLATRDAALIPHQTQDTAVAVGQEGQAPPTPTPAQPTLVLPTATWTGVWTATPAPPTDTPAPPTATWTLPAAAATATRTATRAPSSAATEVATATPSPTATLAASPTAAQATAETATPATVGDQTPVTPEPTAEPDA